MDLLLASSAPDVHEPVPAHPRQVADAVDRTQVPSQGPGLQECHGVGQVQVKRRHYTVLKFYPLHIYIVPGNKRYHTLNT